MRGASYDLIDRIIAGEDRGLIPSTVSAPTNAEAAYRARQQGAAAATRHGFPDEVDIRRRVRLLEEMLRTQPGIHVRQPSHVAPPFRAFGFSMDRGVTAATLGTRVDLLTAGASPAVGTSRLEFLPGQAAVPNGYRAEITFVAVSFGQLHGSQDVTAFGGVQEPRWTLSVRGQAAPGCVNRFPTWAYDTQATAAPAFTGVLKGPDLSHNLLTAPVHLVSDDWVTVDALVPDQGDGFVPAFHTRVAGWLYPVRFDEPGIGGTVID